MPLAVSYRSVQREQSLCAKPSGQRNLWPIGQKRFPRGNATAPSITEQRCKDGMVWRTQVNRRLNHRNVQEAGTDATSEYSLRPKWYVAQGDALLWFLASRFLPPVERRLLTHSRGNYLEQGKPVISFFRRKRPAREADGIAGMGKRKKRMPRCNGAYRASETMKYPTRKGADFRSVIYCEKI